MAQDEESMLRAYEQELAAQQQQANNMPYAQATFGAQQKQNLVEWQLDFKPELDDIERLLRCDIIARDKEGNTVWIANPDQTRIVFNSVGVNDLLRQIRMLLNKNKVLSNYGVEEIKPRIRMMGHEIRMLIYNNYEAYGLYNDYKMNNYPIIVITLLSMIEDSFRRALNGEERKDLNQMRMVNQSESMAPPGSNYPVVNMSSGNNKKHWYNPFSWAA
jgi:hypothetical protein